MKLPFGKRRLVAVGALGAAVAATLLIVLPALGATSSGFKGAISSDGVNPTYVASGGENDCALFHSPATDQYFSSNPKSATKPIVLTASNGATVTLTITVDKSFTKLGFTMSGAVVNDVGIKGGNGTDWYNYNNAPGGGVTHDSGLTGPAQSADNNPPFYGVSQTVFCYTPKITCVANTPMTDPHHPGATIEVPSCAGKDNVFFDFNAGTNDGKNFVSVYTYGGSGTATTPLIQEDTGTLSGDTQPTLQYSDMNPAGPLHDMRFCQLDPRAGGADPLALADTYKTLDQASSVLPPPDSSDPEDSSCLITEHTWVDANGVVHFDAYVYSTIDGYHSF